MILGDVKQRGILKRVKKIFYLLDEIEGYFFEIIPALKMKLNIDLFNN